MKPLNLFLLLTFALFIIGFALVGLLISVGGPNYLVVLVQILMAWTPTMAYAIVHRKANPGQSLWRYVAGLFTTRVRLLPLLASLLIPVVATAVVWLGYALVSGQAPLALIADLSGMAIFVMFFDSLIRGPLGEELGWRGYLQVELNKRFSLLKASLIVGVIWAVWHLPLWFIAGYQGLDLLLYIVFFAVGLIAFSVIIGFVYGRGRNLLYAILLHQMLNFSGRLLEMDELTVLAGSSAIYVIIALVMGLVLLRAKPRPAAARPAHV
ncbi:MAG: CPBP family intramembrane metalloprotease [Candidatus Promineofilum sp.]|jgi:membrane protease YdiL (CAAX protease family)|nr:CPBP family intramembrane metalloprotease [Promineifilum sp.]